MFSDIEWLELNCGWTDPNRICSPWKQATTTWGVSFPPALTLKLNGSSEFVLALLIVIFAYWFWICCSGHIWCIGQRRQFMFTTFNQWGSQFGARCHGNGTINGTKHSACQFLSAKSSQEPHVYTCSVLLYFYKKWKVCTILIQPLVRSKTN